MLHLGNKLWPTAPSDQTTPRAPAAAGSSERNPFDSLLPTSAPAAPTVASGKASAALSVPTHPRPAPLSTPSPGDVTPSGLRTPGAYGHPTHSQATTSVSTGVPPDFTMRMPPTPRNPSHKHRRDGSASADGTALASSSRVSHDGSIPAASSSTATPSSSTTTTSSGAVSVKAPKGHLTVRLIGARNLNVSSPRARPYVVVQFDKNEFVSREPVVEEEADAKGIPTATAAGAGGRSAASASDAAAQGRGPLSLGGITRAFEAASRARAKAPETSRDRPAAAADGGGDAAAPSPAHSPVWKHEVTFDVTHEAPLMISVYDRSGEEEDFLGMREVRFKLVHDHTVDQWFPLESRSDETVSGEVRVQISYERMAPHRLTPVDFEILKLIGRGTFGKVFQVRKRDTKRIYAMKVLNKKEIALKKEVAHTMGERKILQKSLDCPFLVGLKFSFQNETDLFFVTDYKSGGELFWHLQREGRFTEERARFYIAELVLALEHLHKYDIVYRDLKPENILLDATGHVALCDFGLSKPDLASGQLTNTFCGTTEYLAPEVLLDESGYSKLVDFWSLGVLLFEMCCGWSPFYAEDTQAMYRNICFGKIKFPRGVIGEDGKQFVKGLLNRNPRHRLGSQRGSQDLKDHPFFKDIDWNMLYQKQITPPFKPMVESDESVANFDREFTEVDVRDAAGAIFDDNDPSAAWLSGIGDGTNLAEGSSFSRNAPGMAPTSRAGGSGSGGGGGPGGTAAMNIHKPNGAGAGKGDASSPLTRSVQEKFRGFTYSGESESFLARSATAAGGGGGGGGVSSNMSRRGSGEGAVLGAFGKMGLGMSKMASAASGGGGEAANDVEDDRGALDDDRPMGRYAGKKGDDVDMDG